MHPYKVAIVGLGPKGLYAFERLMARLHVADGERQIEIHLLEQSGNFGAGEIYHPDQPEYLLMNYPNRNIDVWPDEHPKPCVPETLSFVQWLRQARNFSEEDLENDFSPRRSVGHYLNYCFELLHAQQNNSAQIIKHTAKVLDMEKVDDGLRLTYEEVKDKSSAYLKVDEVLLTTGHSSCKGKLERLDGEHSSDGDDADLIPFVYPVAERLGRIQKNATVGIKGLGLTFVDAVLALTEGRGGQFERLENGNLIYLPSGNEPNKIFAFSRSGLPMIPRSGTEGLGEYRPVYFTHKNILERVGSQKKISFLEHVLPLFIAEMQYRYYSIVFEAQNLSFYPDKDLNRLQEQINVFHTNYPDIYRLRLGELFKPRPFDNTSAELGALAYMRYLVKEAEIGSESSAFMAAAMTWGRLSETFNELYSFGGMTADSHYLFDTKYRSKLNRISYGPPLQNMRKIMALVETGIVNLDLAENPQVKKLARGWAMYNTQLNFQKVDILVDARIPSISSLDNWSPLFNCMRKRGLLRPFRIHGTSSYEVGCPEINREGYAIDAKGNAIPNISLYGTPTEGITYDNDTLSRTRNNFATQWAMNVLENYKLKKSNPKKEATENG